MVNEQRQDSVTGGHCGVGQHHRRDLEEPHEAVTQAASLDSLPVTLCKATCVQWGRLDVNGDENVVRKSRVNNTQVVKDEVTGYRRGLCDAGTFEKATICESVLLID